jgi:hypothetical protein
VNKVKKEQKIKKTIYRRERMNRKKNGPEREKIKERKGERD